jgi:hypothetical protein
MLRQLALSSARSAFLCACAVRRESHSVVHFASLASDPTVRGQVLVPLKAESVVCVSVMAGYGYRV